ncbi:hypothetical protein ACGFZK_10285 [Streptomyces sp. NPDC048257]|uniref:hypothetical protein n=1 Tax=Streptomyces sp. NPDC048257 TaxID=3365526 RepID=UPI00371EF70E
MHARAHQRFHLDQDGHSITVVRGPGRGRTELLVDGKVVSSTRTERRAATELRGELPGGGAPRPFTVRVGRPDIPGGEPLCVMEIGGARYLMPFLPLTRSEQWPAEPTPSPRTPAELLARWRARHGRHRAG